ncbi:HET-domain-containing protein, partial [Acephala macrosclerotiorum]
MRLLHRNSAGQLSLTKDFVGDDIPQYAILSHTWGADTEEVTFENLMDNASRDKSGYKKILFCGEQASRDGLQYFWVDTCCIDKRSSTELAEAINSMFRWYRNAAKCYVYLSDVSRNDHDQVDPSLQSWQSVFRKSRWFTRGWTLQELIAPKSVEFFCSNGTLLGDKKSLERQLHEITGIKISALQGIPLSTFSVEERMLWAENRQTKRAEDKAYSLLGIFDVYMPLIYGEGADNAFKRLQEEVDKRRRKHQPDELSTDSSTFNSAKRSKNLRGQSSVPSARNPNFFDPKAPFDSELDNSAENGKEIATSIDAATRQSLIDQLYFTKIDERLTSLTAAQGTTCRWFLNKPEYASWHDVTQQSDHGGFLWIKGNPGTGKSTLMKLLFEKAKLNARGDSSKFTLSFFFLARGTVEEKSTVGLYRSLLHQLFEKAVELRDSLEWMTADGARVIQRSGWHEEALKQTLTYAIQKLGGRSLTIFVDALDECNKSQVAGMVCFFEELCGCAREAQVRLQICFSSRHYPTIVIQKGIEVTLEDEIGHTEDIEQYIKSKLRLRKSKQAESLRYEILEKSSRIFLWVVLVLDILNSEYPDSSVSIKKIRERLKEIPPKLTDLFEMILARDGENLERLQVCLKWILFATRPLKPQELYFAIQLGLDKECSSLWDQEDVDLDQMKTFVRSSSKGLAEVTRNKASEVQFIHESVRDFLLGK